MSREALVTGATGFIGRHLAADLLEQGWGVRCLLRPKSRAAVLDGLPVDIRQGPLDDAAFLEEAVKDRNVVYHLAARIRSAPKSVYEQANFVLTRDLVAACLKANPSLSRFLYVSSIAAAGPSPPDSYVDETRPPQPTSEYGRTKLVGEEAVLAVKDRLAVTIVRPPNVYGPGQQETEFLLRLMRRRIVPVLRSRRPNTSLIYIDDLNRGIIQAALSEKAKGEVYFLTDGSGYSWGDLLSMMRTSLLGESFYLTVPEGVITLAAGLTDIFKRLGLVRSIFGRRAWKAMVETPWLFRSDKAARDFGFAAKIPLEDGMRKTVQAWRSRQDRT